MVSESRLRVPRMPLSLGPASSPDVLQPPWPLPRPLPPTLSLPSIPHSVPPHPPPLPRRPFQSWSLSDSFSLSFFLCPILPATTLLLGPSLTSSPPSAFVLPLSLWQSSVSHCCLLSDSLSRSRPSAGVGSSLLSPLAPPARLGAPGRISPPSPSLGSTILPVSSCVFYLPPSP